MKKKQLKSLYQQVGINAYFYNEKGLRCYADNSVKRKILNCFGQNIPTNLKHSPLPTVKVFRQGIQPYLRLQSSTGEKYYGQWYLTLENGKVLTGRIKKNGINFPENLPLGYHTLELHSKKTYQTQIIIAPKTCYQPPAIKQNQHLWGSCLQLYTLKSQQNWGIGDFNDLQNFIQHFHTVGGDFIGLNPIHALFPANPEAASPYSPSSRRWLNILYISVPDLPEFQRSNDAQNWFSSSATQKNLTQLQNLDWIDYTQVMKFKLTGLKFAFDIFVLSQIQFDNTNIKLL